MDNYLEIKNDVYKSIDNDDIKVQENINDNINFIPTIPTIEYQSFIKYLSLTLIFLLFINLIIIILNIFIINKLFILLIIFIFIGLYSLYEYNKFMFFIYSFFVLCQLIFDLILSIKYYNYFIIYFIFDTLNITISLTFLKYIYPLSKSEIYYLKH